MLKRLRARGRERRAVPGVSASLRRAHGEFVRVLAGVEGAKEALVSTVRVGRLEGKPLAEGLMEFEAGIAAARAAMPAWRDAAVEEAWSACDDGLAEAARRAERFRLEGSPEIYEELIEVVAELLDPLEPFEAAALRFRDFGL